MKKGTALSSLAEEIQAECNRATHQNLLTYFSELKKIESKKRIVEFFEKKEIRIIKYDAIGDIFWRLVIFEGEKELFEIFLLWNKSRTRLSLQCNHSQK